VKFSTRRIKSLLTKHQTTQAALAAHVGVDATTVSNVINGRARSTKVEKALEALAGRALFPPHRKRGPARKAWPHLPKPQKSPTAR
jgi:transcriptional regulator with XRE-family HTH domain